MNKNLYIISGCNGAGKTTASFTVLPEILQCKEFVNADEIAKGLSPFNPESVAIEAGRLMLQRIDELLERDETFSIETTLATKSYINLVRRAQAKGIVYTWYSSGSKHQNWRYNVWLNGWAKEVIISRRKWYTADMWQGFVTFSRLSCRRLTYGWYTIIAVHHEPL